MIEMIKEFFEILVPIRLMVEEGGIPLGYAVPFIYTMWISIIFLYLIFERTKREEFYDFLKLLLVVLFFNFFITWIFAILFTILLSKFEITTYLIAFLAYIPLAICFSFLLFIPVICNKVALRKY